MGFESDKLVYDYLGQVGDLAQATPLTAAERARLVARLREDIDARRAAAGGRGDAVREVRKLLDRLGTPDEVVRRAVRGGVPEPGAGRGASPAPPRSALSQPSRRPRPARSGPSPQVPAAPPPAPRSGRRGSGPASGPGPAVPSQAAPPGQAPPPQPPPGGSAVGDWWRLPFDGAPRAAYPEAGPGGPPPLAGSRLDFGAWDSVSFDFEDGAFDEDATEEDGPAAARAAAAPPAAGAAGSVPGPAPEGAAEPRGRRGLLRRRADRPATGPLLVVEALASLVLLAGAVLGLWYLSLLGWVAAYFSLRLGPAARKFAALGIPALVLAGGVVWLWLRSTGRWGGPPLTGQAYHRALRGLGPVLLRTASALSSAYLAWLVRRSRTA